MAVFAGVPVGKVVLIAFITALAGCGTASSDAAPSAQALPSTAPSSTATVPRSTTASGVPEPLPSPTASGVGPEPSASAAVSGFLAQVIVTELIVRSAPGTGSDSEIYPGVVGAGVRLWLHGETVTASGYEWGLAVPERPPLISADPSIALGWVAMASREGEPWIERVEPDCPDAVPLATFSTMSSAERFLCLGGRSLEIQGWVPPVLGSGGCGGEEPSWLMCFLAVTTLVDIEPPREALLGGAAGWDREAARIALHFPPGTRPALNAFDHVIAIGHVDDPAALTCGRPGFPDATKILSDPALIYHCRGSFVVESLSVTP